LDDRPPASVHTKETIVAFSLAKDSEEWLKDFEVAGEWILVPRQAQHFFKRSAQAEKVIETRRLAQVEIGAEPARIIAILHGVG